MNLRKLHSMKPICLCLLLLSLCVINSHAQDAAVHKFGLDVKFGVAIPVGRFAEKNFSNAPTEESPAGLAQPGFSAAIDFLYYIKKTAGVSLEVGTSSNKQDPAAFEEFVKKTYGADVTYEAVTNSWKIFKIMPGVFFIVPFSPSARSAIKFSLHAGACKTAVPEYELTMFDLSGIAFAGQGEDKRPLSWTFCYQADATVNYALNERIALLLSVGYFNANPKYEYSYNPNFPNPGQPVDAEKRYSLASVNVMTGVRIRL